MFGWLKRGVSKLNSILNKPEEKTAENLSYLEYLVKNFKNSKTRNEQITGVKYYKGEQDILKKKRLVIGEDGKFEEVSNLPNNIRIDNQYALAVDKKINYLLGKKPIYRFDNDDLSRQEERENAIKIIFNDSFNRRLKNILKDGLNCGIGYLYVYVDKDSKLSFKRFNPYECYPHWKDDEHTELDFLIRIYIQKDFINGSEVENEYAEVYSEKEIRRYKVVGNTLSFITSENYITDKKDNVYNWGKVPIIPFKYNNEEISLLSRVKNLQDGINELLSSFNDNMEENPRNSILVIHNYDGQKLDEFRRNLNAYGAVKVKNDGGVSSLHVEVNSANYLSILEVLKNALIENAKSYDAKDDRLSGNPNQMNIQSMYSDIDIDSNGIETEYHASFEHLSEFIKQYLFSVKNIDLDEHEMIEVIFNRDVLINESQVISDMRNSAGLISKETLVENHPWVDDVKKELDRIEKETKQQLEQFEDYRNQIGGQDVQEE